MVNVVKLGTWVTYVYLSEPEDKITKHFVLKATGNEEVSDESSLGEKLKGKAAGEIITFDSPMGVQTCKILKIE